MTAFVKSNISISLFKLHINNYAIFQIKSIHDVIVDLCCYVCYEAGLNSWQISLKRSDGIGILIPVISARGRRFLSAFP